MSEHVKYKRAGFSSIIIFILVFISASSLFISRSYAKSVIAFKLEQKVTLADVIVIGEITDIKKSWIGYKYATLKQHEFMKRKGSASEIKIKYGENIFDFGKESTTFIEGERYLLFLSKRDSHYIFVDGYSDYLIDKNNQITFDDEIISVPELIDKIRKAKNNIEKEMRTTTP